MLDTELDGPEMAVINDPNIRISVVIMTGVLLDTCQAVDTTPTRPLAFQRHGQVVFQLEVCVDGGMGGGSPPPERHIRLGDVVVSQPQRTLRGIV